MRVTRTGSESSRNQRAVKASALPSHRDHPRRSGSTPGSQATLKMAVLACSGSVLLWSAHPPLQWHAVAWVALWPWFGAIDSARRWSGRQYAVLYVAGLLFWLATLHWLRLPHWATTFGWVALSLYLAVYLPLFVFLTRGAIHGLKVPLPIAAAVIWVGLEVCRGNFLTGFGMANLAHTQYRWIPLIQCADLFGDYGIGGLIVAVSACLYRAVPWKWWSESVAVRGLRSHGPHPQSEVALLSARAIAFRNVCWAAGGAALFSAAIWYGSYRLGMLGAWPSGRTVRVALIQGSKDIRLDDGPKKMEDMHRHYLRLSYELLRKHRDIDLIIWPETVYGGFLFDSDAQPALPPPEELGGKSEAEFRTLLPSAVRESRRAMERLAANLGANLILGVETQFFGSTGRRFYNSAAFIAKQPLREGDPPIRNDGGSGNVAYSANDAVGWARAGFGYRYAGRFDKMHLVMFGEYVPFADQIPWIQEITPLSRSTAPGKHAVVFDIQGLRFSPNICFESAVPDAIATQVRQLIAQGQEPDVLVNLTNDGWFWGSSELDMHLICGVFRAVEHRKPFLVAANTGFSAMIDPAGRILLQGPRRAPEVLVADVGSSPLSAPYSRWAPLWNSLWVLATFVLGLGGFLARPVRVRIQSILVRRRA